MPRFIKNANTEKIIKCECICKKTYSDQTCQRKRRIFTIFHMSSFVSYKKIEDTISDYSNRDSAIEWSIVNVIYLYQICICKLWALNIISTINKSMKKSPMINKMFFILRRWKNVLSVILALDKHKKVVSGFTFSLIYCTFLSYYFYKYIYIYI